LLAAGANAPCWRAAYAAAAPEPEPVSEPSPALEALADLDPDALTPREALEALYRRKGLIARSEG
jgi:DNA mismatch repair protein MutS